MCLRDLLTAISSLDEAELMKGCEHGELWEMAARFLKLEPKDKKWTPAVKIPGFRVELYQYQYLTVFTMLYFILDKDKRGVINAEEPGFGKVRFRLI